MRWKPFKKEPDPFAHDMSGMLKGSSIRSKKKPWLFRHRWVALSLVVLLLLAGTGGYFVWRFYNFQGNIQEDIGPVVPQDDSLEPFNVLLVGSDSREGLTEEEQFELGADDRNPDGSLITGERADTLILGHIDPETNHVIMIQFPRDLWVPINGGAENKINSALTPGKAELVKTVSDLTGLQINNYAQVNIAGFRDVVDAIHGVELCITEPIPFDEKTGIEVTQEEIDESPLINFDGERALRFVRSRNFATGDFERIRNQQRFLSAAINKITSLGTVFSPTRITNLLNAAEKHMTIDRNTSVGELLDIARKFRNFNPEDYEAYTVPNFGIGAAGEASIVVPDFDTMEVMFEQIAKNESPLEAEGLIPADVDMPSISVGVYNGTFEEGVAQEASEELEIATQVARGTVSVVEVTNADRFRYQHTVIVYDPKVDGSEQKAEVIAQAVPNAVMKEGEVSASVDVALIIGKDRPEFTKLVQIVPIDIPEPSEVPEECR